VNNAPTHSFDAFLSYSTQGDYRISRQVEAFLERFHTVISRSGVELPALRVCRDGSDFRQVMSSGHGPDDAIWLRIQASLAASRHVIVLCSPESAASQWVDRELRWALTNKEPGAILLAVTAGDDPAAHPEGIIPAAAIEAGLHRSQLWYDLRQWRGLGSERIRDAEDELVRLALDLLDRPHDSQPDIATIWQREDLKRRRRTLRLATAALSVVTLALGMAAWQFDRARTRAAESRASSLVRVANALREESPLVAALLFAEVDGDGAPNDVLDVGYTLLDQEFPLARLRGHRHKIVAGILADDQTVRTIDQSGHVRIAAADGLGTAREQVIAGHGKIQDAFMHENGQSAVLAFRDGDIILWRDDGATTMCRVPGFEPRKLISSRDGRRVLVIGFNRKSLVCDFEQSESDRARLVTSNSDLTDAWPDDTRPDTWIAVADDGSTLRIDAQTAATWHLDSTPSPAEITASGRVDWATPGRGGALAIKAGNALLAGRIEGKKLQLQAIPLTGGARTASFAPDGDRLAVATDDAVVSLFSTKTVHLITRLAHPPHAARNAVQVEQAGGLEISALAWSPDGMTLATLQVGFGLRLWHGQDELPTWTARVLRGHDGALSVRWSPDSRRVATLGDDGEIHVWVAQEGAANPFRARMNEQTYSGAVNAETGTLVIGASSGRIRVFDKGRLDQSPHSIETPLPCPGAESSRSIVLLSPETAGSGFWSARADGALTLWQLAAGGVHAVAAHHCTNGEHFAYSALLNGMVFIDAHHRLTLADINGTQRIENASVAQDLNRLKLSPDGRWAVGSSEDGTLVRWDLSLRPIQTQTWRPHTSKIICVDASNAGEVLSTSMDGTAVFSRFRADSVHTAVWRSDGLGEEKWMESCALSEGRAVVSSSTGRAWVLDPARSDVKSELRRRIDTAHVGSINSITLAAPDLAITGGLMDGHARLWNTRTQRLLAQLPTQTQSAVTTVLIKPDGRGAYVLAESGELRFIPLDMPGIQQALRGRSSAELSPPERGELLGEGTDEAYARYAEREAPHGRQPLPADWRFDIPF